ncbi:ABC transporter ATP-binding protein [Falsiroseomonas tokyonensis]|uniref:ABC transporter ATP-binding protein n=1 Tax=Falsiroseomonas tokyonensis TaxID=430521 RepID=A0ABV7BN56_9PROT|nr:ABC transporter ATP-binding protein [Falsiroseomonas tokyonensis]MBU8537020.1 ABC transporter ATP-binding protein [Falsiroseomonas tokyonensis]
MAGIQISSVAKRFGAVAALNDVSLTVGQGEFIALVGPSGCGKTTLMRIVAGIESADAGRILVGGRDVTRSRAADRDIAMVFQSYALYPHLTVAQNIAVPLAMRRLSGADRLPLLGRFLPGAARRRAAIAQDVAAVARSLGLEAMLDRRPGQLSGGQRQRVALARAIIRRPAAFLMDEPLSNLDAALRVQTRREIVDIHRAAGVATLYVTHDQTEALTMADRVAVMMAGRILQVATPEEIYADPQDLRVATFIGSPRINTLAAEAGADGVVRLAGEAVGLVATPGPLTLALRPEDLWIAESGIAATAEAVEFLGESVLLHARHASGEPVILRLPPEAPRPRPGTALRLGFDPARALLFDAAGRRVAAHAPAERALV